MDEASARLAFEQAARLRDQIGMLKQIQATQVITRIAGRDIDAVGIAGQGGEFCVSVVYVRGGRNLGSSNYFPKGGLGGEREMLAAFLAQYYLSREAPVEVLVPHPVEGAAVLEEALSQKAGHAVRIRGSVRGTRARWLEMARHNADLGLRMRASTRATIADQLETVGRELQLGHAPQRIECFDVSHSMGESAVASCVVFGAEGPLKSDYRRFNLRELTPGDDYAGIEQAVERRYARVLRGEAPMPDLLLIDGGPGQLGAATAALSRLGIADLAVVAVAKGADRKAGQERLFFPGQEVPLILADDSPALRLIQRVRDEAHRFAITGHRQSRDRSRRESWLEEIPGLGPKRRRELLKAFGGLQGIRQASVEDLARVHGISRQLAQDIYERMNPGS
jgi:excinuclease ABC subunit C